MGFLNATLLLDAQTSEGFSESTRFELGMVNLAKQVDSGSNQIILPSTREMLRTKSTARGTQIPAMKDQSPLVYTEPSFDIPANLAESAFYTVTPVSIASGLRYYPAMYDNNVIDRQTEINNRIDNVLYAMGKVKEGFISTFIETLKTQKLGYTTQASQNGGTYSFSEITKILSISKEAQQSNMFPHLENLMNNNEQGGSYSIVTSPGGLLGGLTNAMTYGQNNSKDNKWQQSMMSDSRRFESKNIDPSTDNFNGFIIRDGAFAMVESHPFDFRNNTVNGSKSWSISPVELPYIRSKCNIFTNSAATSAESVVYDGVSPADYNMKMTTYEEMLFWDTFYLVERYNSDRSTRPSDVVKIKGLTT
jgi:hypothetical protein